MSFEKSNQNFPQDIILKKRAERFKQGNTNGGAIEVDHILPKYAGGSLDESNAQGLTLPEHAFKHFVDAHDTPPKQNGEVEWIATKHIIQRMKLDEFTDFLTKVEPMMPELRLDLQLKREKPTSKRRQ
jgi:hypothetical protein